MGGTQRLAAVAAVSHSKYYYNNTRPEVVHTETEYYNVNIFFVSVTLCGVLVAVCAACWRRAPSSDKPEDVEGRGVYTISTDNRLSQMQDDLAGPPPAYETVVDETSNTKDDQQNIEGVMEHCYGCQTSKRCDGGLPSYEAALMLRDTKL